MNRASETFMRPRVGAAAIAMLVMFFSTTNAQISTDQPASGVVKNPRLVNPIVNPRTMHIPYPPAAMKANEQGSMGLSFLVKENGKVDKVSIVVSSGHANLDRGVAKSLEKPQIQWQPGSVDGKPMAMWAYLPVSFYRSEQRTESELKKEVEVKRQLDELRGKQERKLLAKK
jgi:TonB family protein